MNLTPPAVALSSAGAGRRGAIARGAPVWSEDRKVRAAQPGMIAAARRAQIPIPLNRPRCLQPVDDSAGVTCLSDDESRKLLERRRRREGSGGGRRIRRLRRPDRKLALATGHGVERADRPPHLSSRIPAGERRDVFIGTPLREPSFVPRITPRNGCARSPSSIAAQGGRYRTILAEQLHLVAAGRRVPPRVRLTSFEKVEDAHRPADQPVAGEKIVFRIGSDDE